MDNAMMAVPSCTALPTTLNPPPDLPTTNLPTHTAVLYLLTYQLTHLPLPHLPINIPTCQVCILYTPTYILNVHMNNYTNTHIYIHASHTNIQYIQELYMHNYFLRHLFGP